MLRGLAIAACVVLGPVAWAADLVPAPPVRAMLERADEDPQVRAAAGRALGDTASEALTGGRLASAWLLASAAARFEASYDALAQAALARWAEAHAVRVQVAPGSSGPDNERLVARLRAQMDARLVRWVGDEQALISGVVGRTTPVCTVERTGERVASHQGTPYTIESWERTCKVGIVGSLTVGNRPYVLNFEFAGTIESKAWAGNEAVGLVGRPLRFDESEDAMIAQIDEALASRAATALDGQATRLLREVLLPSQPDGLEQRATAVMLGFLSAGRADETELLATAEQLLGRRG